MFNTYSDCIDYLFHQFPQFSKYGQSAIKVGLDNIYKLCEALGNPQNKFKSIHIAGTNGKGSTAHMLSAIFQNAGYKTGLYTSPHILDFSERIKLNGSNIDANWVLQFVNKNYNLFQELKPSFFEVTVAMAFSYFESMQCDIAIIETGLGGRLDSTNIIQPILSVITNISLDHTDILGHNIEAIAQEKAGIIKEKTPFVIGERQKETELVFLEHSMKKNAVCFYADAQWALVRTKQDEQYQYLKAIKLATQEHYDFKCDLLGNYQWRNIATVLCCVEVLITQQWALSIPQSLETLAHTKTLSGLRGRWELFQKKPKIILDVAHNPAGLKYVLEQWKLVQAENKHIVIGFVKDKDVRTALTLFPKDNYYYCCAAQIPRALDSTELSILAQEAQLNAQAFPSVADATKAAKKNLKENDALLICGSFFILAEAVHFLEN